MTGQVYRFVGGPFDGQLRVFHEGSGFSSVINLQQIPAGPPIIGRIHYTFGREKQGDGTMIAAFRDITVDWPVDGLEIAGMP